MAVAGNDQCLSDRPSMQNRSRGAEMITAAMVLTNDANWQFFDYIMAFWGDFILITMAARK